MGTGEHLVYNIDVVANTSDLSKLSSQLKKAFSGINLSKGADSLNKALNELQSQASTIQNLVKNGADSKQINAAFNGYKGSLETVNGIIKDINRGKISIDVDNAQVKEAEANLKNLQSSAKSKIKVNLETDSMKSQIEEAKKLTNDLANNWISKSSGKPTDTALKLKEFAQELTQATDEAISQGSSNGIDQLQADLKKFVSGRFNTLLGKKNAISFDKSGLIDMSSIEKYEKEISTTAYSHVNDAAKAFNSIKAAANSAAEGVEKVNTELGQAEQKVERTRAAANQLNGKNFEMLGASVEKNVSAVTDLGNALTTTKAQLEAAGNSTSMLVTQLEYFFSAQEAINLFKRGVSDAVDTIKELDASMTETAVVTNFSVGDMWNQLPTYTKTAQQLGTTIKDVYDATALYYQQGLNTNQSMGIATETLKMARIAGMDASDATDAKHCVAI